MVDFIKILSYRKGDGCTYRPEIGQFCLISGPNCDDDNGYTYMEAEVLWKDDLFVVYRKLGCWPVVSRWEHVRAKPLPSLLDELEEVVRRITDDAAEVRRTGGDPERERHTQRIAVNFIRTHHDVIAEALKDLARMDWLCSDEVHWIEIQSNPRGDYVYVGTDDRTPLRRKIDAAIGATQEGEDEPLPNS